MSVSLCEQLIQTVHATLPEGNPTILIGLSGGLDSCVLLDILYQIRQTKVPSLQLQALHVNHQISPHAQEWAFFCQSKCDKYHIPCEIVTVNCTRQGGESLEEVARLKRYAAYRTHPEACIALAHHLDDQVETFFIQLLRGSGLQGLSGMPLARTLDGTQQLWRPLLMISRDTLAHYAHTQKVSWIEDESNQNTIYLRNFFRHDILPLVEKRIPAYRQIIARTQKHLQEAHTILETLCQEDFEHFYTAEKKALDIFAFQAFLAVRPQRARHALRTLLNQLLIRPLNTQQFEELIKQLKHYHAESHLTIEYHTTCLMAYQKWLYFLPRTPFLLTDLTTWGTTWNWTTHPTLHVPELHIDFTFEQLTYADAKQHYAPHFLCDLTKIPTVFDLKMRLGQETLKLAPNRPRRTLKQHYQSAKIPPYFRTRIPLLYAETQLCFVPFIGVATQYQPHHADPTQTVGVIHFAWRIDDRLQKDFPS